jgi:anti-sigma factor ChrR (cupin superfamily)
MATGADQHIDEETTEKYAMGKLSARVAAQIEEHLLLCGRCRQSLAACDAYIAAMGLAAAKLRRAGHKPMSSVAR